TAFIRSIFSASSICLLSVCSTLSLILLRLIFPVPAVISVFSVPSIAVPAYGGTVFKCFHTVQHSPQHPGASIPEGIQLVVDIRGIHKILPHHHLHLLRVPCQILRVAQNPCRRRVNTDIVHDFPGSPDQPAHFRFLQNLRGS